MARVHGAKVTRFRAEMKALWEPVNKACGLCGEATIDWGGVANQPDSFEMDHIRPVVTHPELEFEPSNVQPSHHRCNRTKNAGKGPAPLGITSEAW